MDDEKIDIAASQADRSVDTFEKKASEDQPVKDEVPVYHVDSWRGRFNPEANDPSKDFSLTAAGIVFVIIAVLCMIL